MNIDDFISTSPITTDSDVLRDLPARTRENLEAAFSPDVLSAAARLEIESPQEWVRLKHEMDTALKDAGSSMREWARAISIQRKAQREAKAPKTIQQELVCDESQPHVRLGFGYEMQPGAIFREDRMREQIAGFSAIITRETVVFDGAEETREYTLDTVVGDKKRTVRVSAREFANMTWVHAHLGARAWIGAGRGVADEVRVAIQRLSGNVPSDEAFAMIGWHKHPTGWRYHHAGGAIDANGVVAGCTSASLPRFASLYELPPLPTGSELRHAVTAAIDCFNAHDAVSAAVFALVWRSVLGPSQASIHIAGGPGSGKSELASIAQRHFGAKMSRRALPLSWRMASDNLMARARNVVGDAVLVIDDLLVRGGRDEERIADRVDAVFRGGWNGAGMERLTRDGNVRAARPPRSTVLSTGETVPQGYSLRQRIFVIDLERSSTPYDAHIRAAEQGLLARAMSAMIRWLAPHMDAIRAKLEKLDADEARSFAQYGDRVSQVAGALIVGARSFFEFAKSIGVLTEKESARELAWVRDCLCALSAKQAAVQAEENPALRFRDLVLDALSTGRAHLTDTDGVSPPENPAAWGWKRNDDKLIAQGDRIGQIHPDHKDTILLDPGPALDVARSIAQRRGNPLPFSSIGELAARLHKAGLLRRDSLKNKARQTYTVRVRVAGRAVDRLWLAIETDQTTDETQRND
jgi:hypothetical protein